MYKKMGSNEVFVTAPNVVDEEVVGDKYVGQIFGERGPQNQMINIWSH